MTTRSKKKLLSKGKRRTMKQPKSLKRKRRKRKKIKVKKARREQRERAKEREEKEELEQVKLIRMKIQTSPIMKKKPSSRKSSSKTLLRLNRWKLLVQLLRMPLLLFRRMKLLQLLRMSL